MHFFVGSWLRDSGYWAALPNTSIHRRRRLFYEIASARDLALLGHVREILSFCVI